MSSWAVISAALSIALFGERLGAPQFAGGAVVIAGALVVSRFAQPKTAGVAPGTPRWVIASLGAAVGFGVLMPVIARLIPAFGSVGSIAVVYLADVALGLPLALGSASV